MVSVKRRMAQMLFVLKYPYKIPGEDLDHIDVYSYVDTTLEFSENMEVLIDAYPVIRKHIEKTGKAMDEVLQQAQLAEEQMRNEIRDIYRGVLDDEPDATEQMKGLGVESVDELEMILWKDFGDILVPVPKPVEEPPAPPTPVQGSPRFEPVMAAPPEVMAYVAVLKLPLVGNLTASFNVPGYSWKKYVYRIPVVDQSTNERITIMWPFPSPVEPQYKLVDIINTDMKPVKVIIPVEEEGKIRIIPMQKDIADAASRIEVKIQPMEEFPMVSTSYDYKHLTRLLKILSGYVDQIETRVKAKDAYGTYQLLENLEKRLATEKDMIKGAEPVLSGALLRKGRQVIPDDEYTRLWAYFSTELRKEGMDPLPYHDTFGDFLAKMPYEQNLEIVQDLIKEAMWDAESSRLRPPVAPLVYIKQAGDESKKKGKFSWKLVGWGAGGLRIKMIDLEAASKSKNIIRLHNDIFAMNEIVDSLKPILEQHSDVKKWLEIR